MISKKGKEALIVKLLKEDRTNREICKIARCSPNAITSIRKTINGEDTDIGIDMKGKIYLCSSIRFIRERNPPFADCCKS